MPAEVLANVKAMAPSSLLMVRKPGRRDVSIAALERFRGDIGLITGNTRQRANLGR